MFGRAANKFLINMQKIAKGVIKRKALKRIFLLLRNLSPETLLRMVSLGERLFIKEKEVAGKASGIKRVLKENKAATKLVINTLNSLSKTCREKFVENFFINAGILGSQQRYKIEKELGFGLPWFFVISPTARCNLNCKGCYAGEYSKQDDLPTEEVDRLLTEAKELSMYFMTISGGEPFVWPSLLEMFKKHNDIFFQIYTNGTLITDEVAKKLSELGNVALAISVEGFEKETDDRRGQGVFKRVMQAMDNLKERGVLFGFSATCTKHNSELLSSDELVDFYIDKGCRFGWYFQYVPIGKKPDISLMSTPEQRNNLRLRIAEMRAQKPIFFGDFWNDGPWVRGCIAGGRSGGYFHVNCQGNVEPCVFLQFFVDNIKGKKIVDVLRSPFFRAFQEAQPYCKNQNLLSPCALIDNPQVLRDIVKKYGAKPSYPGGDAVITDPEVTKFLDNYAKEYKKIVDPVWEKEFAHRFKCWKCG